ncbi:MAX gene-associated protein isoform X2 [Cololabis saira]|uniref:MAX gene-associated protein isoform X2 n=1 Tax=Cololabis saira TaxID=129043 RepID=UPI002AD49013|nr:MAX gene-associated protein isoform X2 [Cololabis saira]
MSVTPATDSELASMEDNHAVEEKRGGLPDVPVSPPPSSAPPCPTDTGLTSTDEPVLESAAVSMASDDCSSALSSLLCLAEASPAKPAGTSTSSLEDSFERSPATSRTSPEKTGSGLVDLSESTPWTYISQSATFGSMDMVESIPSVLAFKGVSVTLENNSVWKKFCHCGTEMILTKQGRRMFPYCRYRLSGLDPERMYSLVLSIAPLGQYRYRWSTFKWEVHGPAEHQTQGLIRAFPHHYSPCKGSEWMSSFVSFYKLKLTNNPQDQDGHVILHSMHRYIPRLHIIPVPDKGAATPAQAWVMGPESMTFTFPQTEFMAVTTYQNFHITQLKINHNPFAKGFREDGHNPRLNRIHTEAQPVANTDAEPAALTPAESSEHKEEAVDFSTKKNSGSASLSSNQMTGLVLKPIMSNPASTGAPYVPCIRGKHALGELVLVQKPAEPQEENATCATPEMQQGLKGSMLAKARSMTPSSSTSTPGSSPRCRKKKRRMKKRYWANYRRVWKTAAASRPVVHSPSLTVAMQPELDEVEGLLFVSFTSKEALDAHINDKTACTASSESPVSLTTPIQSEQSMEVNPETEEEKVARLESVLLTDLQVLKHKQITHPVLEKVGLKLSSLVPALSVDLQYLGVCLPLPPPEQSSTAALSPADEGLPFVSRTGKTSDMTKIKGWRNKFVKSKDTATSNCEDGLPKNLSAFCSNMLDEYLENEAQQISERAAAFSTNPEGSVAYQLPAKSSSYVKTLDSALRHRNAASKITVGDKPCPLSYKPPVSSAPAVSAPPLASPSTPSPAEAQSTYQSSPAHSHPGAAAFPSDASQRSSTWQPAVSPRAAVNHGLIQGMAHKHASLPKVQAKLREMEVRAANQGLSRTQLTPERLNMALSVLLTKQMQPGVIKVAPFPRSDAAAPECGQDFCRLGCLCSSLETVNRRSVHCRRPECLLSCTCQISEQDNAGESDQQSPPVNSQTSHRQLDSHSLKLWNRAGLCGDPEPLFTPKSAPLPPLFRAKPKRLLPHPTQQIPEEEKDPVYKYLESFMTCARVREFNSKLPPPRTLNSKNPDFLSALTDTANAQERPSLPEKPEKPPNTVSHGEKAVEKQPQKTVHSETGAKMQIQIQSVCQWKNDRKMVLEGLCERMKQNRLNQRFYIGPYCVSPVSKIFMRKPSGSHITYRVQIAKPSKASDYEEDESEKYSDESVDDPEEEDDEPIHEPEKRFGLTPFLGGVIPAGSLTAKKKQPSYQGSGLIKVNGKYYNQARLLLGNMGSLHPANRFAAYITGRLKPPHPIIPKTFQTPESAHRTSLSGSLHIKAPVPPVTATSKAAHPKKLCKIAMKPKTPEKPPSPINRTSAPKKSSTPSAVSLTVSPALKSPSFLGDSGTCSFRICPPSCQTSEDQKFPSVALPGGFTLIQLPQHGAVGTAQQSTPENTPNTLSAADAPAPKNGISNLHQLAKHWLESNALNKVKSLLRGKLAEPGSSLGALCEEMQPDENEVDCKHTVKQEDCNLDAASEDLSSEYSDYDEDDEIIDIETVEEEDIIKINHGDGCGSLKEEEEEEEEDNWMSKGISNSHTDVERRRRSEQRVLYTRLQVVLNSPHRTSRLHLLSLAEKEIQNQTKTSRYLEEQKRRLMNIQAVYVKTLSRLAGKPEVVIQNKLKEICERQKQREQAMNWKPIFSQMLETKAALVQATAPPSDLQPRPAPLLPLNPGPPPQDGPPAAAPNMLGKLLAFLHDKGQDKGQAQHYLMHKPQEGSSPITTRPTQLAVDQGESAAIQPPSTPNGEAQAPSDGAALQHTSAPEQASPGEPKVQSVVPFTPLPLIRSKTGRIILPASLKPLGHGYYTLMVMKPKQDGEGKEIGSYGLMQLAKIDPSAPQSDADPGLVSEDKTASPNSDPRHSGGLIPLAQFLRQNNLTTRHSDGGQEGGSGTSADTSGLLPDLSPNPGTSGGHRSVGRPRKNFSTEPRVRVPKARGLLTVRKMHIKAIPSELAGRKREGDGGAVDSPAPIKKRRGRPPKMKMGQMTAATRTDADSVDDRPVTFSVNSFKNGDLVRPLTRGSLGKDFPSEKRRSWIDIERELDPELEF